MRWLTLEYLVSSKSHACNVSVTNWKLLPIHDKIGKWCFMYVILLIFHIALRYVFKTLWWQWRYYPLPHKELFYSFVSLPQIPLSTRPLWEWDIAPSGVMQKINSFQFLVFKVCEVSFTIFFNILFLWCNVYLACNIVNHQLWEKKNENPVYAHICVLFCPEFSCAEGNGDSVTPFWKIIFILCI